MAFSARIQARTTVGPAANAIRMAFRLLGQRGPLLDAYWVRFSIDFDFSCFYSIGNWEFEKKQLAARTAVESVNRPALPGNKCYHGSVNVHRIYMCMSNSFFMLRLMLTSAFC